MHSHAHHRLPDPSVLAPTPPPVPVPIQWMESARLEAFQAFLASTADQAPPAASWTLFTLCHTALRAQLAAGFERLLALDHLVGFTPLPHQVETAERVIREMRGRAILADEVGLGKTIEAGLVIKEYMLRGLVKKALILVPASLVLQWTRELTEKFKIRCFVQRNAWSWAEHDVVIASLDTAKREPHRTQVLNQAWDLVVVDEAHKLKNPRSRNWLLVNQIPNKYMLLLTATPVQNNLRELHALITLLKPGELGSSQRFASEFLITPRAPRDPETLRQRLTQVMVRNRRRDGATNLPKRHVEVVKLTLSDAERVFYNRVNDFLRDEYRQRSEARVSMLPLITLQREICSSPYAAMVTLEKMMKRARDEELRSSLARLIQLGEQVQTYTKVEKVLDILAGLQDKCVIFTEYRATQDFLLYMLRRQGITAVPFRGGFGRGKKDWMQDLFARKVQVLVATESGGEGINLQFCHHMINFDLPWNPMRLEQRIGRIHRLGQTHEVYIYNLSTVDTIEAHIVELLLEKIRMFELVIGELDYIVGDRRVSARQFEKRILDLAMTSEDEQQFRARLFALGEALFQPGQRSNKERHSP
ncbi:putative ATP-dependent helicase YqhH [Alicyclobacillus cellulosilyticus]|uniref:ATP-dependent helicase YqhH n=1 Tax=Alicyclobacillus cellulosilyticus TaxID=1003997 RepID=A0A917K1D9_9BACL|nr:SNF2-related protein [Alicyclobacillus cellulosilyticus]GGI96036.1 putative ATP-dependent helicase YqhH [Alicyclobacillus cellulosilyticus]